MGIIKKLGCFALFIVIMPIFLYAGCETYYVVRNANSRLVLTPSPEIALTADYFYHRVPLHSDRVRVFIQEKTWADMCVDTSDYVLNYILFKGVSWFINNSRVPDEFVTVFQNPLTLEGTKDLGTCLLFSVWNTLPAGIHLFEVRIQTTPFDSGMSHQWAIKIEPTPIP